MNQWTRAPQRDRPLSAGFFLAVLLMTAAFVFGGASRLNASPLAVVELAAIPALVWSLARMLQLGQWRELKLPLAIIALVFAIPLVQLIPLPPEVWRNLPGRDAAATVATLAGVGDAFQPYSLAPHETWKSVLALLPPAGMFLAAVRLSSRERLLLMALVLVAVAANLCLGAGQVVAGGSLYFYEFTSRGFAVGLFSNRNHYAVLLAASLPMTAIVLMAFSGHRRRARQLVWAIGLVVFSLVVVGIIMGRSRAAVGLLVPSMIAAAFILWRADTRSSKKAVLGVLGAGAAAVAVALIFGLRPLLERFGQQAGPDPRFAASPDIAEHAIQTLPFGTGIGSFVPVYQSFEPINLVGMEFLNHAHNDYLELFLEAGLAAIAVFVLFIVWWAGQLWKTLRLTGPYADMALAGAAVSGVLLLHSLVDYPLRTTALSTLFAFALALLATPAPIGRRRSEAPARSERVAVQA